MKLIRIELKKLYKRRSVRVLLGIYTAMMVILTLFYVIGEKRMGLTVYTEGQFITACLDMVMAMILPFIAIYIAAGSFGLELSKGTLKNMMLLPISKSQLYLSKLAAVLILLAMLLAGQLLYSSVMSLLLDGPMTIGLLLSGLVSYLGAFLVVAVAGMSGALLSMMISSTGLSVLVGYLVYILLGILNIYMPSLRPISLSHILSQYNYLFTSGHVIQLLSVWAYYIIIVGSGILLFDKKEESLCLYE